MSQLGVLTFSDGSVQVVQAGTTPTSTTWSIGGQWNSPVAFPASGTSYLEMGACSDANGVPWLWATKNAADGASPDLSSAGFAAGPSASATWNPISPPSAIDGPFFDLYATRWPDGTIQLFGTYIPSGGPLQLWGCKQSSPTDQHPSWHQFQSSATPIYPNGVRAVTLPDGGLQLWALTAGGAVTCRSKSLSSADGWTDWSQPVPAAGAGDAPAPTLFKINGGLGRTNDLGIEHKIEAYYPVFLFGIDLQEHLWMATFTTSATTATTTTPTNLVWTPVTLPSTTSQVAHWGVVRVAETSYLTLFIWLAQGINGASDPVHLYTQYQEYLLPGDPLEWGWTWSGWQPLPTAVST